MNPTYGLIPLDPQLSVLADPPRLCLDMESERAMQQQRTFAYLIGGPAVFLAGLRLKGGFGMFVAGLGAACTVWHYTAHKKVAEAIGGQ